MLRRVRTWILLVGAAWLLVTVPPSLLSAEDSPHQHSVSLVWSHGHLHKVLGHHDAPAVRHSTTLVAAIDVHSDVDRHHSDVDHHHDAEHVTHAVGMETPVGVSTQFAGSAASPSGELCSICAPVQSKAPPYLAFPLRSPTLVSLRTTVLLV